jgi:hypothetical protein
MTSQEVFDAYLSFLWEQFQYDWGWLSSPWLLIIGHILYLMFFMIKWSVLLAPVTVPIFVARATWTNYSNPPPLPPGGGFKSN